MKKSAKLRYITNDYYIQGQTIVLYKQEYLILNRDVFSNSRFMYQIALVKKQSVHGVESI